MDLTGINCFKLHLIGFVNFIFGFTITKFCKVYPTSTWLNSTVMVRRSPSVPSNNLFFGLLRKNVDFAILFI